MAFILYWINRWPGLSSMESVHLRRGSGFTYWRGHTWLLSGLWSSSLLAKMSPWTVDGVGKVIAQSSILICAMADKHTGTYFRRTGLLTVALLNSPNWIGLTWRSTHKRIGTRLRQKRWWRRTPYLTLWRNEEEWKRRVKIQCRRLHPSSGNPLHQFHLKSYHHQHAKSITYHSSDHWRG